MDSRLEDFRVAAGALIDSAVVSAAADRDGHQRVRLHLRSLNAWFADRTGWRVQDHPEFVRLVRPPTRTEPSHAAPWARDKQDYELFAWILWYGEHTAGRKFTVSQLAEEIRDRSARAGEDAGFDWRKLPNRRRLVRVFAALEQMGALRVRDGSLAEWQDVEGKRDALCEWGALAWQLHIALDSATLAQLADVPAPALVADHPRPGPRMRAYRQLLLGPALFRREDPEALDYLTGDRERLRSIALDLLDHTGWHMETTPTYARLLRGTEKLESVRPPLPIDSSLAHLVVLLCRALRECRGRDELTSAGDDFYTVTEAQLELLISEVQDQHSGQWKKDYRTATAAKLLSEVVPEMKRWGLLRGPGEHGNFWVTPLAARLSGEYRASEGED